MAERGAPRPTAISEVQLLDFARSRFYNYTLRQLVPSYIALRDAPSRELPEDTQEQLAAALRERLTDVCAYAALGQIPDPNAVVTKLLQHMLEQASQGRSSTPYLPKHQEHVEALLQDVAKGDIAFTTAVTPSALQRYREMLIEDMRTLDFFGSLMD